MTDARDARNSDGCWLPTPARGPAPDADLALIHYAAGLLGEREALARLTLSGPYQWVADALATRTPGSGGQSR